MPTPDPSRRREGSRKGASALPQAGLLRKGGFGVWAEICASGSWVWCVLFGGICLQPRLSDGLSPSEIEGEKRKEEIEVVLLEADVEQS